MLENIHQCHGPSRATEPRGSRGHPRRSWPRSCVDRRSTSNASATRERWCRSKLPRNWMNTPGSSPGASANSGLGLGFRHLTPFANRPPNEMVERGIAYGKGLQLINVLRDRAADRAAGRNYLPAEELAVEAEETVFVRWLDKAAEQLDAGIDYARSLTNWRVRFATALPALIGARTLALLRAATAEQRTRKIKVTRARDSPNSRRRFVVVRLTGRTSGALPATVAAVNPLSPPPSRGAHPSPPCLREVRGIPAGAVSDRASTPQISPARQTSASPNDTSASSPGEMPCTHFPPCFEGRSSNGQSFCSASRNILCSDASSFELKPVPTLPAKISFCFS